MKNRVMYLRAHKSDSPVGCLVIHVDRHQQALTYQLSVLNPADHFDRKVARQLALGRLVECPITVKLASKDPSMHDISRAVMASVAAADSTPGRAVRAAKEWLSLNS